MSGSNPLDGMTWEQRFMAAFAELLQLQCRYAEARAALARADSGPTLEQIQARLAARQVASARDRRRASARRAEEANPRVRRRKKMVLVRRMLRAGATYERIRAQAHVGSDVIAAVKREMAARRA